MSPIARTVAPITSSIEPAVVVGNIIAQGMNLPPGRVMMTYERVKIPSSGLFIAVGYLGPSEQIAARSIFDAASDSEVQELLNKHDVQIDIMSIIPDNSARLRRWEIPMSLNSLWARNYAAGVGVGLQPLQGSMTDTSGLEAGGYINRYTTRAVVFAVESRTLPAGSFNKFHVALTSAQAGSSATKTKTIPMEEP